MPVRRSAGRPAGPVGVAAAAAAVAAAATEADPVGRDSVAAGRRAARVAAAVPWFETNRKNRLSFNLAT